MKLFHWIKIRFGILKGPQCGVIYDPSRETCDCN